MWAISIAMVVALIGSCQATVKEATAICMKDELTGMIEMSIKIAMRTEPEGFLHGIDNQRFQETPFVVESLTDCYNDFENNVYTVKSDVFDDPIPINPLIANNGCGVTRTRVNPGNRMAYEWLFLQTSMDDQILRGNDRVFRVRCFEADIVSNFLYSEVVVISPSLMQEPNMLGINVLLELLVENQFGNFVPATVANANDNAKLRLTYFREPNFDPVIHIHGIYGYSTYVSPDGDFSTTGNNQIDFLTDIHGCAYVADNAARRNHISDRVPPYTVDREYTGSLSPDGSEYYSTTGTFNLWKYTDSDFVVYKTSYGIFYEPEKDNLNNACEYLPFLSLRKKRDVSPKPDYEGTVTTRVRIVVEEDTNKNTADAASSREVAIIVGAVLGAALVMVAAGAICLVVVLRGKRTLPKSAEASRTSSTVSFAPK